MLKRIKRWLEPPIFPDDEEKTAKAQTMNTMGLYFMSALIIAAVIYVPLFAKHKVEAWAIILALYILYAISRTLMFRGKLAFAGMFIVGMGWIVCEGLAFIGGGIASPMMFALVAITIAVGLLYSPRVGTVFLVLSILTGLVLAALQQSGVVLPQYFNHSPLGVWFFFTLSLVFINWTMNLTVHELKNALALAKQQNEAREKAETTRRESEEKYRLLFDNAGDAIFIHDESAHILAANSLAVEQLGYTRTELMTMTINQVDAPEEGQYAPERTERVMRQGYHTFETVHICKNGSRIPTEVSARRVMWDGMPAIMSICRDVAERKEAEKALRASEERLTRFMDSASDSFYLFDSNLNFVETNKIALEILGKKKEDVIGRNIVDIVPDVKQSGRYEKYLNVIKTGEPFMVEDFVPHPAIGEKHFILTSFKVGDGLGITAYDITERKKAEAALKESEARLRTIYDMEPECVKILNPDCTLVDMNPAGLAMIEAESLEMVKGQSVLPILDEKFRDEFKQFTQNVCQKGESGKLEFMITGLRGTHRWLETRAVPLRDSDGKIAGLLGVTRDITERKHAEEKLEENRRFLADLFEYSATTIFVKDIDGRYEMINRKFEEEIGLLRQNVIGRKDMEVYSEPVAVQHRATDLSVIESGEPLEIEDFVDGPSGRQHYLTFKFPLRAADGSIRGICGMTNNITARRLAEDALRASNAKLETLIQVSPLAIMLLDSHGNVQLWNQAAEQIFGWTAQEIIGKPNPIVPTSKQTEYATLASQVDHGKVLASFETVRQRKDGSLIDVSISSAPVNAADGLITGRMAIIADVTGRKRIEIAERNQRALAEALSNSAAALNSTLNFDDVMDQILDNVGGVVPHDSVGVILLDAERQIAQIVGYRDTHERPAEMKGIQFSIQHTRNLREMQATGAPVIIADTRTYDGWLSNLSNNWVRASLGVPITVRGKLIGFLCLQSSTPNAFSALDAERLQAFSDHAAIAIENARLYAEVQKLALTDILTGIFNRTFFETELARMELGRDFPVSVMVADLDNMKITNDSLGHPAGDELLKHTVRVLQAVFRASDIVARIGGDEFAVLLPNTDAVTAEQILSRIRIKLAEHNDQHPELPIELSLGVSTAEQGGLVQAFAIADRRMYENKAVRKSNRLNNPRFEIQDPQGV